MNIKEEPVFAVEKYNECYKCGENFVYGTSTSDQTQDGISCSALRTTADRFGTYFRLSSFQ